MALITIRKSKEGVRKDVDPTFKVKTSKVLRGRNYAVFFVTPAQIRLTGAVVECRHIGRDGMVHVHSAFCVEH